MYTYPRSSGILVLGALQIIGLVIAMIALYVFISAIQWKLFKKAGEKGWKALIPVYNVYILFRICWSTKWFWIMLIAAAACSLGMLIPLLGPILMVAGIVVALFIEVFVNLQLAKAFGKEESYGIGLAILGPVFEFILAFDNNVKYVGPQADPQFFSNVKSDIRSEVDGMRTKEQERPMNFDPYTGQPINRADVEVPVEPVQAQMEKTADTVEEVDDDIHVIEPGQLKD